MKACKKYSNNCTIVYNSTEITTTVDNNLLTIIGDWLRISARYKIYSKDYFKKNYFKYLKHVK